LFVNPIKTSEDFDHLLPTIDGLAISFLLERDAHQGASSVSILHLKDVNFMSLWLESKLSPLIGGFFLK
jgi:hypothetical protein